VDVAVDIALNEEVIDGFCVLVLAGVGCSEDGADTDCVLVYEFDGFLGVDDIAILCAVDVLFLDIEVSAGFLEAFQLELRITPTEFLPPSKPGQQSS
jgi:hypothetical protein